MPNRFDWITSGERSGPDPVCDLDLRDHQLAAVVPTLGGLVPGWLLVIPRIEALGFRDLQPKSRMEVLGLARTIGEEVSAEGGQPYILEHGPSKASTVMGCGVDQAHLHVVPLQRDLLATCLSDRSIEWFAADPVDPWRSCEGGREYLLICKDDACYIGYPSSCESQYFRKKIAQLLEVPDVWDYRRWPFYENARRTIDQLCPTEGLCAA